MTTTGATSTAYLATSCARRVWLDHDPRQRCPNTPAPAGVLARIDAGRAFEADAYQRLTTALDRARVVTIPEAAPTENSRHLRETLTAAAMDVGADLILNPRIAAPDGLVGEPDVLLRHDTDDDGTHRYVPIDVKHHSVLTGSGTTTTHTLTIDPTSRWLTPSEEADVTGKPRQDDLLQLAHYHRTLAAAGRSLPDGHAYGYIYGSDHILVAVDLNIPQTHPYHDGPMPALELYDAERSIRQRIIAAAADLDVTDTRNVPIAPHLRDSCHGCPWAARCAEDRVETQNLTVLPGITLSRARALGAAGITRVDQLAALDLTTAIATDLRLDLPAVAKRIRKGAKTVEGAIAVWDADNPTDKRRGQIATALAGAGITTVEDLAGLRSTQVAPTIAGLKLADAIAAARAHTAATPMRRRNTAAADVPDADIVIDFDIEDSPDRIHVIGVRHTTRTAAGWTVAPFQAFTCFDDNDTDEAAAFAEFWQWLTAAIDDATTAGLTIKACHYHHHEVTVFRKTISRLAGQPGIPDLDALNVVIAEHFWDLSPTVRNAIHTPTPSYTLKDLAGLAGFTWADDEPSGDNALVWIDHAITNPDPAVRQANRDRVIAYNRDDVDAQTAIRRWLAATNNFADLPAIDDPATDPIAEAA